MEMYSHSGMNNGRLIFSHFTDILDPKQLTRCIAKHPMPRASRNFNASDQFRRHWTADGNDILFRHMDARRSSSLALLPQTGSIGVNSN